MLVDRSGNKDKNPNNFIFPVLSSGITHMRQYELIELFVASINDWMLNLKTNHYQNQHKILTI